MHLVHHKDISFYQLTNFNALENLEHGFLLRKPGHSKGPYKGMNISLNVGDKSQDVHLNRELIRLRFGFKELVFLNQVHGTDICIIENRYGKDDSTLIPATLSGDAMVTNIPGKLLIIQVADCQSVLLYDPNNKVIGNVHSGWKGSINNIIGRTVATMQSQFHSLPENIVAGIGPSLGPCCSEFINYQKEIPHEYWHYKDDRDHFDFWAISRDQLLGAGILPANISFSNMCTKCNTDLFFSYRKEDTTGRFAGLIGMKLI